MTVGRFQLSSFRALRLSSSQPLFFRIKVQSSGGGVEGEGIWGTPKPKEFVAFSLPPDLRLWESMFYLEVVLLHLEVIALLPLQNLRNSLVFGLRPAGGACLGGLPAAGIPPPRPRALCLVAPGPCLAIRGRGVSFRCDHTLGLNQDTESRIIQKS